MAGVAPIGLQPKRRTAAIVDPSPWDAEHWPMVLDVDEGWYARPEARTRLMVSPADETLSYPHDVRPEEIDVATGIDRMQQALDIEVRRVEHSWAGLRTFTPDGSLAFGWGTGQERFFWCVGQGGYGIQTSPAAGRLAADLVLGRDPGEAAEVIGAIDPGRFHKS
jgi:D-arginine dehydrogenase